MTNEKAIYELEKLQAWLYELENEYHASCDKKYAKAITNNMQDKIYALELAIKVIDSIEKLTNEEEE